MCWVDDIVILFTIIPSHVILCFKKRVVCQPLGSFILNLGFQYKELLLHTRPRCVLLQTQMKSTADGHNSCLLAGLYRHRQGGCK